jgi:hypothetical protein
MTLTSTERYVLQYVLAQVIDGFRGTGATRNSVIMENILISMSKSEFQSLCLASEKIAPRPKEPRTREKLIGLFTYGEPYALEYRTLGNSRRQWLADKPVLDTMIKDGLVKVVYKKRNTILYQYTHPV